jgi:hypothetical protein
MPKVSLLRPECSVGSVEALAHHLTGKQKLKAVLLRLSPRVISGSEKKLKETTRPFPTWLKNPWHV